MRSLAFLVLIQRRYDIAPALSGEIRNTGSRALAVQAMAALALLVRHSSAGANVRRAWLFGRAFLRAADHCHRQEYGEQEIFRRNARPLICRYRSHSEFLG